MLRTMARRLLGKCTAAPEALQPKTGHQGCPTVQEPPGAVAQEQDRQVLTTVRPTTVRSTGEEGQGAG